jgi:hypothetical protein
MFNVNLYKTSLWINQSQKFLIFLKVKIFFFIFLIKVKIFYIMILPAAELRGILKQPQLALVKNFIG